MIVIHVRDCPEHLKNTFAGKAMNTMNVCAIVCHDTLSAPFCSMVDESRAMLSMFGMDRHRRSFQMDRMVVAIIYYKSLSRGDMRTNFVASP